MISESVEFCAQFWIRIEKRPNAQERNESERYLMLVLAIEELMEWQRLSVLVLAQNLAK